MELKREEHALFPRPIRSRKGDRLARVAGVDGVNARHLGDSKTNFGGFDPRHLTSSEWISSLHSVNTA